MANLTQEIKIELRKLVYDFISEECEVELEKLNDQTTLMEDLDGDSLLFVELVELMKKKYGLNIKLQNAGMYLHKNPAETIGQVIEISFLIYEHENDIVNLK
ncbi:acyl carrier protein [Clostridium estertheticum]|uniref:acyl carrier protein n=1 Tax=Clostridium estertheticum TaxID=238834 RepID=UPI001C7CFDCF|nr:acyl carrier protein [Clostridium estertheticum]MBX4266830.1 acyl carrier protein [Clostridium estertheticum]WLC89016.1 acyl carrier protein [Clostridium estertheticum]